MRSELFTIVCDYADGTYVSQVNAPDPHHAMIEWAGMLRRDQPVPDASESIAFAVEESDMVPVLLSGLSGAWSWSGIAQEELILVTVIQTSSSEGR